MSNTYIKLQGPRVNIFFFKLEKGNGEMILQRMDGQTETNRVPLLEQIWQQGPAKYTCIHLLPIANDHLFNLY